MTKNYVGKYALMLKDIKNDRIIVFKKDKMYKILRIDIDDEGSEWIMMRGRNRKVDGISANPKYSWMLIANKKIYRLINAD